MKNAILIHLSLSQKDQNDVATKYPIAFNIHAKA